MASVGHERTAPEEQVATILSGLGVRYRRNMVSLPGKPDFVLSDRQIVIFVYGCFWHRHAKCRRASMPRTHVRFWQEKFALNQRRDRRVARQLRMTGWKVLTIWECRLAHAQGQNVVKRLRRELAAHG